MVNMAERLEERASPKAGEVSVLNEEEIKEFMEPLDTEETRKIFDYLAEWRRGSLRSEFVFDYRAVA